MNIFCTKAWNDFMCKMNTHIRTEQLSLFEMGDIFFSEWSFLGFKKWILYGTTCDKEDKLVDMIIKSALKRGIFAIESNFNMARWRKRDYFEKVGKITKEFGTYVIDLSESEDKLWERVHSKHRNVIRRAIKEGVEINLKLNINDFLNLLIYTYSKGGQKNPLNYDVIVTTNLFGDILSDLCSQLVGGMGFACSGNIGEKYAVFEPTHGSAPKYAGQYKVNPIASILAAKMMLDWLGETDRANLLYQAVKEVIIESKVKTYDMGGTNSTIEMANAIAEKL